MHDHRTEPANLTATPQLAPNEGGQPTASHSMWLMALCCVPMVLIAIALLVGAFGAR
jgi:hypothetical protein